MKEAETNLELKLEEKELQPEERTELSKELTKMERQQAAVEEHIRQIIIEEENFLENDMYISLMNKQTKQRTKMDDIKQRLGIKTNTDLLNLKKQTNAEAPPVPPKPPVPVKSYKKKAKGKTPLQSQPSISEPSPDIPAEIPELKEDPNLQYINDNTTEEHIPEFEYDPNLQYINDNRNSNTPKDEKKASAKPNEKLDTWQCHNCDFINDVKSDYCDVCNEPNLWKCTFCNIENIIEVKICIGCGKTRVHPAENVVLEPEVEYALNQWSCQYCTVLNKPEDKVCSMCGKTRDKAPLLLVSDWECPNCYHKNPAGSHECEECSKLDIPGVIEGWTCDECTFYNHENIGVCGVCGAKGKTPPSRDIEVNMLPYLSSSTQPNIKLNNHMFLLIYFR